MPPTEFKNTNGALANLAEARLLLPESRVSLSHAMKVSKVGAREDSNMD